MRKLKWIDTAYGLHICYDEDSNEVLAEVNKLRAILHDVLLYECEGKKFIGLDAAKQYAEHKCNAPKYSIKQNYFYKGSL